jgi:hypothetical protein
MARAHPAWSRLDGCGSVLAIKIAAAMLRGLGLLTSEGSRWGAPPGVEFAHVGSAASTAARGHARRLQSCSSGRPTPPSPFAWGFRFGKSEHFC